MILAVARRLNYNPRQLCRSFQAQNWGRMKLSRHLEPAGWEKSIGRVTSASGGTLR